MSTPPGGAKPRVLLVDDDATIRRFVGMVLEDLEIEFVPCADADAARAALRQAPAALLLTDLMMPGEDGFSLLASLQADPALRGPARLAVFSAGLNAQTRARLQGLDVWRELAKPVSATALEACVAEATGVNTGAVGTAPPPPAGLAPDEQRAVAEQFAGDIALYRAFRAQALRQFGADRQALAQALIGGDWPAVHRQAHSLKGALATLGDHAGAGHARTLEAAAARGDDSAARAAWPALDRHLETLLSRGE